MEFQFRYLALCLLFSVIEGFEWFWIAKSSQEFPVNVGVPWSYTFLTYIIDLPDDVICYIAIYADDSTLYSKSDQASDLWRQLELVSELESDLRDTGLW